MSECPHGNTGCQPAYHGYYAGTDREGYYYCDDCWADENGGDAR